MVGAASHGITIDPSAITANLLSVPHPYQPGALTTRGLTVARAVATAVVAIVGVIPLPALRMLVPSVTLPAPIARILCGIPAAAIVLIKPAGVLVAVASLATPGIAHLVGEADRDDSAGPGDACDTGDELTRRHGRDGRGDRHRADKPGGQKSD